MNASAILETKRWIEIAERGRQTLAPDLSSALLSVRGFRALLAAHILSAQFNADASMTLAAGPFVGAVDLKENLGIRITEKTTGALESLLHASTRTDTKFLNETGRWQHEVGAERVFFEYFCLEYLAALEEYVTKTMMPAYERAVQFGFPPRGKIRVSESIVRGIARGRPLRLSYLEDRLTFDTAPHRVLKTALSQIVRAGSPRLVQKSRQLEGHFHDVGDATSAELALSSLPLSSESQLDHTLMLAQTILAALRPADALSIATPLPFSGLINLERLFERAVIVAVERFAKTMNAEVFIQGQGSEYRHLFPDTESYTSYPDAVFRHDSMTVVLDAKYRVLDDADLRGAIYQAIAHCDAFRSQHAILVGLTNSSHGTWTTLGQTPNGISVQLLSVSLRRREELFETISRVLSTIVSRHELGARRISPATS